MFTTVRHVQRATHLVFCFARNGAFQSLERIGLPHWATLPLRMFEKPRLPRREGQRLCLALAEMGPSFIKLGQALSTRPDLVGDQVAADLSSLQDNLPPFSTTLARRIIEEDLGKPLGQIYSHFEVRPVAAASIAQVHYATTTDGRNVAVKVVRPNLEPDLTHDFALFYWLAERLEYHFPETRRMKPVAVVKTFEQSIRRELDLRMEAASAETLRENTMNDDGFYIPEVDWSRTSERVLTIERVDGIPISNIDALKEAGHDMNRLIEIAANSFFQQVFRDGFFHADLHPGNLFVRADGKIVAVDFGITGWVDVRTRWFVAEILRGFLTQDFKHVAEVHIRAGYVPRHHSVEDFALACRAIGRPVLGKPLQEISIGQLLGQLIRITALYDMETQPQLLLLQKNMVLAEGVGRMLNPDVNMWQLAEPLIERWAAENLSPMGRAKVIADETLHAFRQLPEITHKLSRALDCFDSEGFKVHPSSVEVVRRQRSQWHQRWWTLAWVALITFTFVQLFS